MEEKQERAEFEEMALAVSTTPVTPPTLELVFDPKEAVMRGREVARMLKEIVEQSGWTYEVGRDPKTGKPKEALTFPAWQTIGTWYGVVATIVELKEVRTSEGKLIRAEARALPVDLRTGRPLVPPEGGEWGIAERDEMIKDRKTGEWKRRWDEHTPEHTIIMTACTRAKRRVLQNLFTPIVALAGYTPEEEGDVATEEVLEELTSPEPVMASDWGRFWSQVKGMGLTTTQVHEYFSVSSLTQIVKTKQQLENILNALREAVQKGELVPKSK